MESYTASLGSLQQKILKHFLECPQESENAKHIADVLKLAQPTVYESVQDLIKKGFIIGQQQKKHLKKSLDLTDKGVAAIFFSDPDENLIRSSTKGNSDLLKIASDYFSSITTTAERKKYLLRNFLDYALSHNIFENGTLRSPSPEEARNFQKYMLVRSMKLLGPESKIENLKQLVDIYQLDTQFLKEYLLALRRGIDLLLQNFDSLKKD